MSHPRKVELEDYLAKIASRPAGYTRANSVNGKLDWESVAWDLYIDANPTCAFRGIWTFVGEFWTLACSMMGLTGSRAIDKPNSQELSEQFYALFIDLVQEAAKGLPE